jgi:hypothetical protein
LIDFLIKIREPFFTQLDLIKELLSEVESNANKSSYEKSIGLLSFIHRRLIDSYLKRTHTDMTSKFLMFLFVKCMQPFLRIVDAFVSDGVVLDINNELGFRRNASVNLSSIEYWQFGYEYTIEDNQSYIKQLPEFLRIILQSAFRIHKNMEIIKLLKEFNGESNICDKFLDRMKSICAYLAKNEHSNEREAENSAIVESKLHPSLAVDAAEPMKLLRINFIKLLNKSSFNSSKTSRLDQDRIVSFERLYYDHYENETKFRDESVVMGLNMEKEINDCVADELVKCANRCSKTLVEKLLGEYKLTDFFSFLHSYYLFKSNEIVFLFAKSLFDMIKNKETFKDDAVLNSLLHSSSSSVFTTSAQMQQTIFDIRLITVRYEANAEENASSSNSNASKPDNNENQLIDSIRLDAKLIWPFNIIIKQSDLCIYNRLFLFIIQIKQIKYELDNLDLNGFLCFAYTV